MLLTGADASAPASWVAVNSGIPYGNIDVQDNDISGNYISGGSITAPIEITGGDITLSGGDVNIGGTLTESVILSGIALAAENVGEFSATKIYPLGITGSAQLTAISGVGSFTNVIPDLAGGRNYYYDDYASTNSDPVATALDLAVAAFSASTGTGDMLYVRFGFTRSWSRGNGGRSSRVSSVVGFLKKGAHVHNPPTTSDVSNNWVQISRVYHGRGNSSAGLTHGGSIGTFP
jgi:hypothetical protein